MANILSWLFNSSKKGGEFDAHQEVENSPVKKITQQSSNDSKEAANPKKIPLTSTILPEEKERFIEIFAKRSFYRKKKEDLFLPSNFEKTARIIVDYQIGSVSLIQHKLKLTFNEGTQMAEALEIYGVLGKQNGNQREVLLKNNKELLAFFGYEGWEDNKSFTEFYKTHFDEIERRAAELEIQFENNKLEKKKEIIRQQMIEQNNEVQLRNEVAKELIAAGAISKDFTNDDSGTNK